MRDVRGTLIIDGSRGGSIVLSVMVEDGLWCMVEKMKFMEEEKKDEEEESERKFPCGRRHGKMRSV